MKVELHLHTSRYSECCPVPAFDLMRRLIETGYQAVYITEHDAVWSDEELAWLGGQFPELRIFPGVELSLEGQALQHLVVLGTNDPAYVTLRKPGAILAAARAAGHLTVLAHPFRWEYRNDILDAGLLPDALEYRTCNQDAAAAAEARAEAEAFHLPLVNSGDVHALDFINRFWIETHRPIDRPEDIRQIVLDRAYDLRPAEEPG